MKCILISISILVAHLSFAQFAIVSDKDGFSNIRKTAGPGGKIIDTLNNGHFVYCLETKDDWTNINYTKKRQDPNGYIYHDRLKRIADYENIPRLVGSDSIFSKDSLKIILSGQPFKRSNYRLTYYKDIPAAKRSTCPNPPQAISLNPISPPPKYITIGRTISCTSSPLVEMAPATMRSSGR